MSANELIGKLAVENDRLKRELEAAIDQWQSLKKENNKLKERNEELMGKNIGLKNNILELAGTINEILSEENGAQEPQWYDAEKCFPWPNKPLILQWELLLDTGITHGQASKGVFKIVECDSSGYCQVKYTITPDLKIPSHWPIDTAKILRWRYVDK